MIVLDQFAEKLDASLTEGSFAKLTLSKPFKADIQLKNAYVRVIDLKGIKHLSVTFRYKTKDETKNFTFPKGKKEIKGLLEATFKNAALLTNEKTYSLLTSKKGKRSLTSSKSQASNASTDHDRQKIQKVSASSAYLHLIGVTTDEGQVIPKMADKYRQINKFLEVMEGMLKDVDLSQDKLKVVDMGSGKGYLTFGLYDFLVNTKGLKVQMVGVEQQKSLVDQCNKIARECGFDGLNFEQKSIDSFNENDIDILIALHACDTATDDALAKGIKSKAKLIVCAPCCHKQIRQQLKGKAQTNPILKHGIFKERQYEMVTDAIRALILEREGYESKVFEFISNEHTRKNVMLVGVNKHKPKKEVASQLESIKQDFGIEYQQLEKLI